MRIAMSRTLLITILLLMLAACGGVANVPVINKSPHRTIPAERVVAPGDSIYSVSWEYGLDYLDIAKWNRLRAPYDLKPGQRLSLRPSAVVTTPLSQPQEVVTAPLPDAPAVEQQPAAGQGAPAVVAPAPPAPKAPAALDKTQAATVAVASTKTPLPNTPPSKWRWPAKGNVIARFSRDKGINGIRIAGSAGSPVLATAGGDVVYVGEGLRGYGKLIILKHSATYLSAYAHNRRIMVAEGDRIGAGQQIAEMGSTGAEQTMLHFEIRVNGKPQDPLKYLDS